VQFRPGPLARAVSEDDVARALGSVTKEEFLSVFG
jgi:hypothetical protein